jgi:hypothetical protein
MKTSKEMVLKSGLLPRLQLGIKTARGIRSTGRHTVKVIEDKLVRKPPREEGDDGHYVRYIVEEAGERKQYDTRLKQRGSNDPSYFVQAMAGVEPGEEIVLEMKKAGIKNYINIERPALGQVAQAETEDGGEPADGEEEVIE